MMHWKRIIVFAAAGILLSFTFAHPAQAVPLNHGVDCTANTIIIGVETSPGSFGAYHSISCDTVVEQITVQAARNNLDTDRYLYKQLTCYNTSSCSLYLDSTTDYPAYGYQEGTWYVDTAGRVEKPGSPYYYGATNNSVQYVYCYGGICNR